MPIYLLLDENLKQKKIKERERERKRRERREERRKSGVSEEIDEITSLSLRFQRDKMDFIHELRKCMTI